MDIEVFEAGGGLEQNMTNKSQTQDCLNNKTSDDSNGAKVINL